MSNANEYDLEAARRIAPAIIFPSAGKDVAEALQKDIAAALAQARAEERERCARIVDRSGMGENGARIAAAIRAGEA